MKRQVLTSGVDSEYVLGALCSHLRGKGWRVVELDFGQHEGSAEGILSSLATAEVAYITSAHTNLSLRVADRLAPSFRQLYPNYLCPLEIISRIEPCVSIYVPHDLLTPYGDANLNEFRFLDLFDHVLAPIEASVLQATLPITTRVHDAGWIKYAETRETAMPTARTVQFPPARVQLFISMIEHLRGKYGVSGLIDYLRPLFGANVRIKLPEWKDVDKIELALRETGAVEVIASQAQSTDLIRNADVVVCNGASSIHAEAALLGRPTICLLDDEGGTAEEQRAKLAHLPNIHFHDFRHRAPLAQGLIDKLANSSARPLLRPFDYELVEQLIEWSSVVVER